MRNPSRLISFSFLFFFSLFSLRILPLTTAQNSTTRSSTIPVNLGVILDFDDDWIGKIGLSCINMSLSDFYATHPHYKTRLLLNTRDSNMDVIAAAASAWELITNAKVEAIIGPATSRQSDFVIELGNKSQVPIMSFSASTPFPASIRSPYFFQATQNDKTQARAIADIVKHFRWRSAVPIYVDDDYGVGIIPYLIDSLQAVDATVPYQSAISPYASDDQIVEELYKLKTSQTTVFVVHMLPSLGTRIFTKAKELGMISEGYVWIMSDGMANLLSSLEPSVVDLMQGILGVKPYVSKTKELENFRVRWKRKFHQDHPDMVDAELNVYGLWAYDATTALAMAVETVAATTSLLGSKMGNVSQNGPKLVQALSNTSFRGLTGNFLLVNQQLQPSVFQVLIMNGVGPRGIGFWTQANGLVKKLNSTKNAYSTPQTRLAPIIWPGDSTTVPKGWKIPTDGKKLRIGVPVDSFPQFVKVTKDPSTSTTKFSGYCIDIFDAVMKELPYAVPYEYIPFAKPDGANAAGTTNDLVYQVYLEKFDAVIGDITIVANRSLYVDFSMPYTESDVAMVVPIKDYKSNNAFIFLKPFSWNLWLTILCFFVNIGFVIWVLEHRINEDFRGPPSHQAGTSLWFAFSTIVFAHRERVINNLARIVVIIWSMVVLIITQSYTASLTSLLTVQKLQPAVTDVTELLRNKETVGYQKDSFVSGILTDLGFQESQLLHYSSPEECDQLLSKTSRNGGIAAAFDESPYMNLILARNCSNYTMVDARVFMSGFPNQRNFSNNIQQFKTGGFGFAFPRGSPLVADVSRAILKVRQDDVMRRIEDAWLGENICPSLTNSVSSSSLDVSSFWALFVLSGGTSFLALMTYIAMFVHKHWEGSKEDSVHGRLIDLLKIFNQKDLKSHTFRKSELGNSDGSGSKHPSTDAPNSPFSDLNCQMQQLSSAEIDNVSASVQAPQVVIFNGEVTSRPNEEWPSSTEITHQTN